MSPRLANAFWAYQAFVHACHACAISIAQDVSNYLVSRLFTLVLEVGVEKPEDEKPE
jgi:hypothetical protein